MFQLRQSGGGSENWKMKKDSSTRNKGDDKKGS